MTEDYFVNQLHKLAEKAERERVKLQEKFDNRSEEWQEGEQGEQCQATMEAWDDAVDDLNGIADNFTEDEEDGGDDEDD